MFTEKKVGLVVASLALILTIVSFAPQLVPLTVIPNDDTQNENIPPSTPAPIPAGMIAYWELNENSGVDVYDRIDPYIRGLTSGGPTWVPCVAESGLELLSDQFIDFGSSPNLYLTNTLTIEAWVNLPDTTGLHTILMNSYSSTFIMYQFAIQDGALYFDRQSEVPGNYVTSSASINANQWHHVAVVMNWDNTPQNTWVSFYIDGVGETIDTYNDEFNGPSGRVTVGADVSTGVSSYLLGMIDEVAIYNSTLAPSIIQEHYEKGLVGLGYLDDFPPNEPPVALDDAYTIDQDTPLIVDAPGVLENDYDNNGDVIEAEHLSNPANGGLVLNPDGSFVYTPASGFVGIDYFDYRAFDGTDYSMAATVTITVEAVNHPPVAVDDYYTTDEDLYLSVPTSGVLENDYDPEPWNYLSADLVTGPQHGLLTLNTEGDFEYTPEPDWFGIDYFTYRVFDGTVFGNEATVTITVNAVNDAPEANDDSYSADEGYILSVGPLIGVLSNDLDIDSTSLTAHLVAGPAIGTLTLNDDGSFEYFVDGWSGPVTFTYRAYDGTDYSSVATVTINVIGDDDKTGPEITIMYTGDGTDGVPGAWSVAVVDPESGVHSITVEIDGVLVGTTVGTYAVPNTLGIHTITVTATNADLDTGPGDQETSTLSDTINIDDDDVTGPSIFITYVGDMTDANPGVWTVTVSDSISGVHSLIVEIDGVVVGTLEGDYAVPNSVGDHTITVTALNDDLDRVGDQETSSLSDAINIVDDDITGPSIFITYVGDMTDANPGVWTVIVSDSISGVHSLVVEIDGVIVGILEGDYAVPSSVGDHTITVTALNNDLDRVGDQETSVHSDAVTIVDTSPPETSIELSGIMGLNNWYISDVTVTLTVSDAASTAYSINGGSWLSYSGPFVVGIEGDVTISYNSTDYAGNREVTKEASYQMDKTQPVLTFFTETILGDGELVTIVASDDISGLFNVGYSLDGVQWADYEDPFLLSEEGLITVYFRAEDLAGNSIVIVEAIEVIIEILTPPTELLYSGDVSGVYSDPVYLEALLIDATNQLPIVGKTILFTIGYQSALAVTDSEGFASVILILDQCEGVYMISVSFDGDDDYLASFSECEFTINKEFAITNYTGVTVLEVSEESITLMATVFDDADGHWGDITHIYVTFTFYLSSDLLTPVYVTYPVRVHITAVAGVGLATLEIPNLPEGEYLIVVNLLPEHNRYYCSPDSDTVTVTIYEPERAWAKGVGTIKRADGGNGYFVFNVKYDCKDALKGFIIYTYIVDDWVYVVRSSEIMGLVVDGNYAFFEANCTISRYNFLIHAKVCSDETYRVRIDVFDNKKNHEKDVFQIRVSDGIGLVEYEAGYDPYGYLVRGCIVVNHGRHRHRH